MVPPLTFGGWGRCSTRFTTDTVGNPCVGAGESSRTAILSVIVFFVVGGLVLTRVDVAAGERAARAADQGVRAV